MAVHIHICSSYDAPTLEAKKCLWLITTGEQEDLTCEQIAAKLAAATNSK